MEEYLQSALAKTKPKETIREHTDRLKKEAQLLWELGYIKDEKIKELLLEACEYHDYGKVNSIMQERMKGNGKYDPEKEIPHNVLSYYFVPKEGKWLKEDYDKVAFAVLYHHYRNEDLSGIMREKRELIQKLLEPYSPWLKRRISLKNPCVKYLADSDEDRNAEAILLKGLLHKCDYSASAHMDCEYPADFLTADLTELLAEWKKKNEDASWNCLQNYCMEHQADNLIVTAPTGMGKTEAGLWWIGDSKGFFVLPLRTAINAMYDRIRKNIIKEGCEKRLALLHSEMKSYYSQNMWEKETEEDLLEYASRSRQTALPLTICTLDQVFDFVFKYPGYEYKLATLSYSKLVIDEIQMYDPSLLAYLVYGIQWIHQMGGKVAVMTATLPPYARQEIYKALDGKVEEADFTSKDKLPPRHRVKVVPKRLEAEDILQYLDSAEKEAQKILIVCNGIDTAQNMLEQLEEQLGSDAELQLLHSQFIRRDRAEKEEEIIACGSEGDEENRKDTETEIKTGCRIWIATSIVEASLDIDFDILFTELMDLFSLFQRMGRCNRKGLKSTEHYNCFVYTEKQGKVMRYVDKTIYARSKEAIEQVDGLLSEIEKVQMIEDALSAEVCQNSSYAKTYQETMAMLRNIWSYEISKEEVNQRLRGIVSEEIMPYSVYEENKTEIDALVSILNEKTLSVIERQRARDQILQYSVSVQHYKIKNLPTVTVLPVGRYETIRVLECEYTKRIGLKPPVQKKETEGAEIL